MKQQGIFGVSVVFFLTELKLHPNELTTTTSIGEVKIETSNPTGTYDITSGMEERVARLHHVCAFLWLLGAHAWNENGETIAHHNIKGVDGECVCDRERKKESWQQRCGAFLTSKVREYNSTIDMVLPRKGRRAM
jgi:hypothetical protein